MASSEPRLQSYRYGWFYALLMMSGVSPTYAFDSVALKGFVVWAALEGAAAAFVKPWGWYVLVLSQPVYGLVFPAYCVTQTGPAYCFSQMDPAISLGKALAAMALAWLLMGVTFVYFYRRRAMFGAGCRWYALERRLIVGRNRP